MKPTTGTIHSFTVNLAKTISNMEIEIKRYKNMESKLCRLAVPGKNFSAFKSLNAVRDQKRAWIKMRNRAVELQTFLKGELRARATSNSEK